MVETRNDGRNRQGYEQPRQVIKVLDRIVELVNLEAGGIEYDVEIRTSRQLYYDVNALSNFVADPVRVIGFNPSARLADFLIAEAQRHEANRSERVAAGGGPR